LGASFAAGHRGLDLALKQMVLSALDNIGDLISDQSDGTSYVSTGDIPAEWFRDSSVEVRPLLYIAKTNRCAAELVKQVIARHAKMLSKDPYANAFKASYETWERKYELDSLAYPILLAWSYWKVVGDSSFFTPELRQGFAAALRTMEIEQDHQRNSRYSHPQLRGNPTGKTGMIWSGFRPSDDASHYNFLIPSEMMAVQALGALAEMSTGNVKARAIRLRNDVFTGIQKFGTIDTVQFGRIYAYEVDGLGVLTKIDLRNRNIVSANNHQRSLACKGELNLAAGPLGHGNLMDDGNLPSLLSAPLFGWDENDPIYQNTRRFSLSLFNPCYFSGVLKGVLKSANSVSVSGLGSPHTEFPENINDNENMIWPLGILARGMTANSAVEKCTALQMLRASDPGDHKLHESFNQSNQLQFTRKDFGWPNAMLFEFIELLASGHQNCQF